MFKVDPSYKIMYFSGSSIIIHFSEELRDESKGYKTAKFIVLRNFQLHMR